MDLVVGPNSTANPGQTLVEIAIATTAYINRYNTAGIETSGCSVKLEVEFMLRWFPWQTSLAGGRCKRYDLVSRPRNVQRICVC